MNVPIQKRILDRVTITGADDNTNIDDMIGLYDEFPFVEWGILLSASCLGGKRFPSFDWLRRLYNASAQEDRFFEMNGWMYARKFPLSGHLCGSWVRELLEGNPAFTDILGDRIPRMFSRFQINTHAQPHSYCKELCTVLRLSPWAYGKQFIFQMDGVNEAIFRTVAEDGQVICSPFFDTSHGAGRLPKTWPNYPGRYCGYGGGLTPDNIESEMERIYEAVNTTPITRRGPVWIDVETGVRTNEELDIVKVGDFLKKAKQWVIGSETT